MFNQPLKRKTMTNEKSYSPYQEGDDKLLGGYVNSKKTMQLLQCKKTKLYYLRKKNELVFSKIGRVYFYEIKSIKALINRNKGLC